MKVFMLGWEFPPYISGGLGTACYGLTKGLDEVGVEVTFVLPTAVPVGPSTTTAHVSVRSPATQAGKAPPAVPPPPSGSLGTTEMEHVRFRTVPAALQAYATPESYRVVRESQVIKTTGAVHPGSGQTPAAPPEIAGSSTAAPAPPPAPPAPGAGGQSFVNMGPGADYAGDLMEQVRRYARLATEVSLDEPFDVVHAHDWMTYPAGLSVAAVTNRPLVIHVHSTEFDRSGERVNQQVYDIERAGMHGADRVICVSHFTRNIVINRYGVEPEKVSVVYNAVEINDRAAEAATTPIRRGERIVLFLGRITMQKGPEYFLAAAKKVLEKYPNVRFVMAGSGDMIRSTIEMAAQMGIGQKVTFTGFLRGADVDRIFQMADLYVMPSVSEPFGIAPLEAMSHNVPVLISKQSGVSEVIQHALKVDFWDIDEMANKILAVLRHPPLQRTLREHGSFELRKLSWRDSAVRCKEVYEAAVAG